MTFLKKKYDKLGQTLKNIWHFMTRDKVTWSQWIEFLFTFGT